MYKKYYTYKNNYAYKNKHKKSGNKSSNERIGSRRGQITIFIILGIIILFAFLLIIALKGKIQMGALEKEKEETFTGIFRKEALRLYVEDCLRTELEKGLVLIGRQGRLWNDQPGGRRNFEDDGTEVNGERVFYAIKRKNYQNPIIYPCMDQTEQWPFCQYSFPKTEGVDFGVLQLKISTIQGDLQRYLEKQTVACVEQFVKSQISQSAVLEASSADVTLRLHEDSISASIEYPLSFKVGGQSFFQLSSFKLFYPSKLKQFLSAAVAFPLERDQKYVDYAYDASTLTGRTGDFIELQTENGPITQNTPAAVYRALSVRLDKQKFPNGDTLFTFSLPEQTIINQPGSYVFQFVRQNRPPALDYISQCPAENYDYLAVAGAEGNLGKIDFTLAANDPDEEEPIYSTVLTGSLINDEDNEENPSGSHFLSTSLAPGEYSITASASDSGNERDLQDIRVRVDPIVRPTITFRNLINGESTLSLEDPVCINKETSGIPEGVQEPDFVFWLNRELVNLDEGDNALFGINPQEGCMLENYDINALKSNIAQIFPRAGTNNFRAEGQVSYGEESQCRYNSLIQEQIMVNECIPYEGDLDFPNPYINNQQYLQLSSLYQYDVNAVQDDSRSPFEANHACCTPQGRLALPGTECYAGDGCFTNSFYLERASVKCDGMRGNICGGQANAESVQPGKNICGRKDLLFCSQKIDEGCEDIEAYSARSSIGWCEGNNGCENLCTSEIVVRSGPSSGITSKGIPYPGQINLAQFACGCSSNTVGYACDKNFDAIFDGICSNFDLDISTRRIGYFCIEE